MAAEAATYCVATDGNDADPGTEAQPWRTLKKAAASVQPGDTVRIRAGDYYVGESWTVRRAGTEAAPITYRAYGDGEVRITNSKVVPPASWTHVRDSIYSAQVTGSVAAVFQNGIPLHSPGRRAKIHSVDSLIPNSYFRTNSTVYVRLEDGSDPRQSVMRTSPGHVVQLYDCHYTIFEGLTVEFGYTGFKRQGAATHHVTYRGNTIRSIINQGIQPVPSYSVIERNLFQKIGANKWTHAIYTSTPGIVIRHNIFEEIAGAAIHQFKQSAMGAGKYEIYGNVCRKPRKMTYPTSGGGYYVDMIIWEEGSNRIYNNVFHGEGKRRGISLNSPNNLVYNNTFVDAAAGIQFYGQYGRKAGNRVCNNIFLGCAGPFVVWPTNALPQTLDHNLYYSTDGPPQWQRDGVTYTEFSEYQRAAGETHSRHADPMLAGPAEPRPQPGSPAIDRGLALAEVTADIEGVRRPQGAAHDIGAYEFREEIARARE
ncbi:MAG: right-handed parallel beta-helix repeat-containing protein [Kiritimatiellae bacterium]|nr:right-handed parallel beta-helix repeat-containing protein [Kiritimatiellia bacterium]